MAIKGFVEVVGSNAISGWCVDDASTGHVDVEVRVGSVTLGSVHADIPRPGGVAHGFRFPLSAQLFRLLPDGAEVEVTVEGQALPFVETCSGCIRNPEGAPPGKLEEVLSDGRFISPKSGAILRPFKERFAEDQVLGRLEQCQRIFHELFSKRLFVCYGTLLGVIRENDFIAHDDDVDVCFMADGDMSAALEEFHRVVEVLRARGEDVRIDNRAHFHWRGIDVFVAWFEEDHMYLYNAGGHFSRDDVYPLRMREFKGLQIYLPNNAEGLLELIYGSGWHIPDPSFQWRLTDDVQSAMGRVAGHEITRYWKGFYHDRHTMIPSAFATSVAVEWNEPQQILEIGSGNGRDAFFFAGLGHRVLGLDAASTGVERCRSIARERGIRDVVFEEADVSVSSTLEGLLKRLGSSGGSAPLAVYARFFFHAVTAAVEDSVLSALAANSPAGTCCFFEFRTDRDEATPKRFGNHFRRYINLDRFVAKAVRSGSFECVYRVEGQGLAKYGDEDPFVGRVYLRRR